MIVYNSLSGNTQRLAEKIGEIICISDVLSYKSVPIILPGFDFIFLGSFTIGNGKIPPLFKKWVIKQDWREKQVVLFGSGNSVYPHYCGALDGIHTILTDCYAIIHPIRICIEHGEIGPETILKIEEIKEGYQTWMKIS